MKKSIQIAYPDQKNSKPRICGPKYCSSYYLFTLPYLPKEIQFFRDQLGMSKKYSIVLPMSLRQIFFPEHKPNISCLIVNRQERSYHPFMIIVIIYIIS